jgi:Animal haem peroxidase
MNHAAVRRDARRADIAGHRAFGAPQFDTHLCTGGDTMSKTAGDRGRSRITRRAFVGGAGLGAGAVAAKGAGSLLGTGSAGPPTSEQVAARAPGQNPLNFGRMFPQLPAFAEPTEEVLAALREIGRPGGIMDAQDDLAAGPVLLITDESLQQVNRNNTSHTAGTTFVGQFLDHDITFDSTSQLGVPTEPQQTRNTRVASLDLDSVYGGGPNVSPQLYQSEDRAKLRIESGGTFEDLPRNADGSAIIADPRNDENLVISGLQAAFIIFHNTMVDRVRTDRLVPNTSDVNAVFTFARNETRWHYQRMILTQFLPQVVGQPLVNDIIRRGRRFYRPQTLQAYMPVEFQTGAYRMGHSMVRPSYRVNFTGQPADRPNAPQFFGFIFDPGQEGIPDSEDMRGGSRAPRRYIGWPTFFDFGDGNVRNNKIMDTVLSTPLFQLPLFAIASGDPPTSLPERNLLRHVTWSMPSGQAIAQAMRVPALSPAEMAQTGIGDIHEPFLTSTPLWFYVLHEALVRAQGLTMGPVGGRIVAEVVIGLMQLDPSSVMRQSRWRPRIPVRESGRVLMQDILDFAGVSGRR